MTPTWTSRRTHRRRPDGELDDQRYDVQFKLSSATSWTSHTHTGTGTSTTISSLTPGATYDVQVMAKNDEGDSDWSATGSGDTNANAAPVFTGQATEASVDENSADGTAVVTITATDADTGDTISYSLDSTSDKLFNISSSGVITVNVDTGSALDHEATSSITATVTATDSNSATATHDVTISVTDVDEPPDAPAAPSVSGASSTSVTVSWTAPTNTGKPAINDYDVQFKLSSATSWTSHTHTGTGTSTTISSLTPGATYDAQVMAKNDEGDSDWSATGSGDTNANAAPVFTGQATEASVDENSADGTAVVTITATDADTGDTISYSLDTTSDKLFDIDGSSGAITVNVDTGSALDHEGTASITATVTATDSHNATATHDVTISVADVDEPPDAPAAPSVSTLSVGEQARPVSLNVNWTAPNVTGRPAITSYDVQYKKSSATSWISHPHTGTVVSTTIGSLESRLEAGTEYDVQVRANNDEGTGKWSATGKGTTAPPDTTAPRFSSATVNRTALQVVFDENLDADSLPGSGLFNVQVAGDRALLTSTVSITGKTVSLTLLSAAPHGATVTVAYSKIGTGARLQDPFDNEVATFGAQSVTNDTPSGSDTTAPSVSSAKAKRKVLEIVFNEHLDANSTPPGSAFNVRLELNTSDTIPGTSAAIFNGTPSSSESTVTVVLAEAVPAGEGPLYIGYTAPATNKLQDAAGNRVLSFGSQQGTNNTPSVPAFASDTVTRTVAENTAAPGNVGAAVTATDDDGDTLTYSLSGASAAFFAIGENTGQITVGSDTTLDFEANSRYEVTVQVTDGEDTDGVEEVTPGIDDTIAVTINVTDVNEPPPPPDAPTVSVVSTSSLDVSWTAPDTTGRPAVSGYDVQYQASAADAWTDHPFTGTGTSTTISSLTGGTTYAVQVRAKNDEGDSAWSASGSGTTNSPIVTISAGAAVTEGTAASFTVTASEPPGDIITVNLTVSETSGSDFVASGDEGSQTVTIAADSTTAIYFVTTQADSADEPDGSVTVTVATGADYTVGTPSSAIVNVNDDDDPPSTNNEPTGSVTIDGTATQGETLTANTETVADADGLGTFSYQWQRGGTDISGATSSTYTLVQADVGSTITVTVSWTDDEGATESLTSAATSAVASPGPTITVTAGTSPVTEGTAAEFTVTADAAPSADLTVNLTVSEADGSDFVASEDEGSKTVTIAADSTTATYSVATQADNADEPDGSVTVEVATGAGYIVGSASSASVTVNDDDDSPNNAPTGSVTIDGTATQGETLTANTETVADVDGLGTFSYQWQRGGTDISGATSSTYTLVQADVGSTITVTVSWTDDEGATESLTSAATSAVASPGPTITVTAGTSPVTEGTAAEFTVTADAAPSADLTVNLTVSEADGSDFVASEDEGSKTVTIAADSTTATYSVATQADNADEPDGSVTVEVATGAGYIVGSASSASVTVNDDDDSPNNAPTGSVTIDGTATQGETLTANTETVADVDGLGTFSYQWQRGGTDISGATSSTYTLVQADVGSTITVTVSWTDDEGATESLTSAATSAVASPGPTITVTAGTSPVTEGTAAEFTVTADAAPSADLTVNLTVSEADGSDFVASEDEGSKTVTIAADSTTATYSVATQADNADEPDGSVTVEVATGAGYIVGSASSASVTVNDDDDPLNAAPVFTSQATTATVPENSTNGTAVQTGDPAVALTITATDSDTGDTISYSLDATSDKLFDIGSSSGAITVQLDTGSALDHEGTSSITATVTATDSNSATATHDVTISVTDVNEPPDAPAAPDVTGASSTSVTVSWTAPDVTGKPAINGYDVQYKLPSETDWTDHSFTGTGASTTISSLTPSTTYEVQVKAKNDEGDSGWSATGSGATNANAAPVFTGQVTEASVDENSADGTAVVTITATDSDTGDTISYSLDATSDKLFDIGSSSGAITVQLDTGSALDHEGTSSITATVTATDSNSTTATHDVTITVADVDEPPDAPAAPSVTGASTTSVDVSWTAPDVTGKPAINGYEVQYRVAGDADWTDHPFTGAGTGATISSLTPGATYEVQVKAKNDEGDSGWSDTGSGGVNNAPTFTSPPDSLEVAENSAGGTAVGTVAATDPDAGDTLTYSLDPASGMLFSIGNGGNITVTADNALDHEGAPSYKATVTVTDGKTPATHDVTISVTDVDEPPDAPAAPTVEAASSISVTVSWTAPANTGKPAINDYDVQYKLSTATEWTDHDFTGTGTSTTLSNLAAGATYEVQVRAANDEGKSDWSATGSGTTDQPAPVDTGSRASGSTVTLEFESNLDATSVPDPQDFTVTVTGGDAASAVASRIPVAGPAQPRPQQQEYRVTAVSIRGSMLDLTISPPVRADQTVTVSYTPGVRPLRTDDGAEVAEFTVTPANETPPNQAPTADAGADAAAAAGAAVTLDGSASADPDGDTLTYSWTQTAGAMVRLAGADSAQAMFTAPSQPGALTFRLMVTDPGGLTAVDTVTVTVRDGAPDFGGATVAALSLDQGQAIGPVMLPAASGGNGALTYSLTSSPAGLAGLVFDPATRTLSGTPQAPGLFVFTYRAEDADANRTDADAATLTFQVAVSATADRKKILTHALAGMGQQLLSNALDNIGARFDEPAGGNNVTVAGRSLASLGLLNDDFATGTSPMAWARPQGPAFGGGASGTLGRGGTFGGSGYSGGASGPGANGAFGGGTDSACGPGKQDPQAFASGGAASCGAAASQGGAFGGGLMQSSAFSWRLGAASNGKPKGARWSVWGRGDLGMFEGRPDAGSGYDGETRTGWLGIDARSGPWVAGVALSRGTGESDYNFNSEAGARSGRLEIELTALYPYARWAFANGVELQGILGAGSGDARHFTGRGAAEDADLKMRLGSLGVRGPMAVLAGLDINARADLGFVRMETGDGADAVHGLTADAWRARFGLEASRQIELAPLCVLVPFVELAGRQDSGDGLEGTGVEVAGGVRFSNGGRFQLEARGRVLALHSADGAEERGVSLTARLAPRADGGGLTLALTPRWGAAAGSAEALWRHEMPHLAHHAGEQSALLDAQAGYGFLLPGGLLTPFTEANLAGADHRVLRAGVRFESARTRLQTELLIERHETLNAQTDHGLRLSLGLGF